MKSLLERAQEDLSLLATLERGQGWERTATTENSVFKLSTSPVGDRSINFTFPVWHLVRCARDSVSRCRPPRSPAVRASGGIVCPRTASGSDRGCRLAGLDREWSLISRNSLGSDISLVILSHTLLHSKERMPYGGVREQPVVFSRGSGKGQVSFSSSENWFLVGSGVFFLHAMTELTSLVVSVIWGLSKIF